MGFENCTYNLKTTEYFENTKHKVILVKALDQCKD